MTILVTGATGNIGRRVVDGLVDAGQRVRAMSRDPLTARFADGVEVVYGDFERPETWPAVLDGVERVYLFPFAGKEFVAEAARTGVRRFVVHSAAAAGFTPSDDPEDRTLGALRRHLAEERRVHRGLEVMVETTGVEWTHVRPGLLAANALGWAERIRAERVVREQAAAIGAAIGEEVRFEELSPRQAREQWIRDGLPEEFADWRIELLADAVDGTGALPPTDTFHRITGRPPRGFGQWAVDHAADFRPR